MKKQPDKGKITALYENFLAARRENYHRKKHDEKGEQIA